VRGAPSFESPRRGKAPPVSRFSFGKCLDAGRPAKGQRRRAFLACKLGVFVVYYLTAHFLIVKQLLVTVN